MRRVSLASCLPPPTLAQRFTLWTIRRFSGARGVRANDISRGGTLDSDLRLFALTYVAGFMTVSLFLA